MCGMVGILAHGDGKYLWLDLDEQLCTVSQCHVPCSVIKYQKRSKQSRFLASIQVFDDSVFASGDIESFKGG